MIKDEAKPHILLVEDARDIREPLARYLREHGYRATTAPDSASARKVLKGAAIDLIVLDIMMPEMDGYATMQVIRQNPAFRRLPIVALTAKAMKGDRAKCIEAGATDYVTKPVDAERLLAVIHYWVGAPDATQDA